MFLGKIACGSLAVSRSCLCFGAGTLDDFSSVSIESEEIWPGRTSVWVSGSFAVGPCKH